MPTDAPNPTTHQAASTAATHIIIIIAGVLIPEKYETVPALVKFEGKQRSMCLNFKSDILTRH